MSEANRIHSAHRDAALEAAGESADAVRRTTCEHGVLRVSPDGEWCEVCGIQVTERKERSGGAADMGWETLRDVLRDAYARGEASGRRKALEEREATWQEVLRAAEVRGEERGLADGRRQAVEEADARMEEYQNSLSTRGSQGIVETCRGLLSVPPGWV